jgi:hypothetical protein
MAKIVLAVLAVIISYIGIGILCFVGASWSNFATTTPSLASIHPLITVGIPGLILAIVGGIGWLPNVAKMFNCLEQRIDRCDT